MRIQIHISSARHDDDVCQKLAALLRKALEQADEVESVNEQPDLIHVLGLGDRATTSLIRRAKRLRIPLVISPLGAFQPWMSSKPSPHVLTSTRHHRNTIAIHAISEIERENLATILPPSVADKVMVHIANPIVTTAISEEGFCQQMRALYADTAYRHDEAIRKEIDEKTDALKETDGDINNILRQTFYANYQHQQGHIAQSTLERLADTLTNSNYDESLFAERIEQIGLTAFFTQMETLMQERGMLTEGFMPIPAKPAANSIRII